MNRIKLFCTIFFIFLLSFEVSFADQPAICETSSFVHIENLIEVSPHSCGYGGCGVFITAPNNYEGAPFEDYIVSRGSLGNSDLSFQLRSHPSGQMMGAAIYGEQTQVEQFTVTAVYKSENNCLIHSSVSIQHNNENQPGTP